MIENTPLSRTQSIPDSRVDHDRVVSTHYQGAGEVEPDSVMRVCRMFAAPQLARRHAEHASAVVTPDAVGQKRDRKLADLNLWRSLDHRTGFAYARGVRCR